MSELKSEPITAINQYIPPEQLKEVSIDLALALQESKSIRVSSEKTMEEANAICGRIRARQKGIEAFRLAIVKPLKDHIAKIDKFFKDLQGKFEEPLSQIEGKVLKYREGRKQPLETSSYQEGVGRTTFVKDVEITIDNQDLIPESFWVLDEAMIKRAAKTLHLPGMKVGGVDTTAIPGVSIKCVERPLYVKEK